jgi:mannose-1-phosphate guanylyltransferase
VSRVKALLLAGGLGTRLRPLTDTVPKCLVEIGGRPLLAHWFDALRRARIRDTLINTHHLPEPVRNFLRACRAEGFRADESFEPTLLGSAGTIAAAADWAGDAEHVVIIYADNFSDVDLVDLLATHERSGRPMTMLLFHTPRPSASGIAELDASGLVVAFEEKPAQPKSDLANAGVYVVTAQTWKEIAAMGAFDIGF